MVQNFEKAFSPAWPGGGGSSAKRGSRSGRGTPLREETGSPFMGVIAEEGVTRTGPKLQNRQPSGSTSHHLPSSFPARKRPVAFSRGPFVQPP